jgi:hypothetical protein
MPTSLTPIARMKVSLSKRGNSCRRGRNSAACRLWRSVFLQQVVHLTAERLQHGGFAAGKLETYCAPGT